MASCRRVRAQNQLGQRSRNDDKIVKVTDNPPELTDNPPKTIDNFREMNDKTREMIDIIQTKLFLILIRILSKQKIRIFEVSR